MTLLALAVVVGALVYELRRQRESLESMKASLSQVEHIVRAAVEQRSRIEETVDDHSGRIVDLERWKRRAEGVA